MWNKVWEKVFRENEWGKYPSESLIRFVARNFYKADDRFAVKILEVGCGTGANLWYMLREGFSAATSTKSFKNRNGYKRLLGGDIFGYTRRYYEPSFSRCEF